MIVLEHHVGLLESEPGNWKPQMRVALSMTGLVPTLPASIHKGSVAENWLPGPPPVFYALRQVVLTTSHLTKMS